MRISVFLLLAAYLFAATGESSKPSSNATSSAPPLTLVEAVPVKVGDVQDVILATGDILADESVTLASEISGRIATISFIEGSEAKAGESVLQLDDTEYMASVRKNEADLNLSQLTYQRLLGLSMQGAQTEQAKDEAKANLSVAEANLLLAKAKLAKTKITAPFDGIYGLRLVSPGAYLSPGQGIVQIQKIKPLKIKFRIPEVYASLISLKQTISFSVDALPKETFSASILSLDAKIDQDSRSLAVLALIQNPIHLLKPGMFCRIKLFSQPRINSILVPEEALIPVGSEKFVFQIIDRIARRTKVAIGQRQRSMVEILSGLKPDAWVVTGGQLKIRDGSMVSIASGGQ